MDLLISIFNHFFSTKDAGTGLGLSVVNRVIKAHNGFIETANPAILDSNILLVIDIDAKVNI